MVPSGTNRRWNLPIWVGFAVTLAALLSYIPLFARFPITRDFPWANLLLFAVGLSLTGFGLLRAYREPEVYRSKVSGIILETLGAFSLCLFIFSMFYYVRLLPPSHGAPRVGQKAPDFTLSDRDGNAMTISKLLAPPPGSGAGAQEKPNGAVLIFYRGYW